MYTERTPITPIIQTTSRIELPALVVLILTFAPLQPRSPLVDVLPHLRLPALTPLQLQQIHPAPNPSATTHPQRASLRPRTRAHLPHRLALPPRLDRHRHPRCTPSELRAWLALPGACVLETMCLVGGTAYDSVLADMTWAPERGAAGTCLPGLRHLGLAVCAADVDDGVLLRMVGSRLWTPVLGKGPVRTELRTVDLWVRECTPRMVDYERMVRQSAERIPAWRVPGETRELQFTEV